MAATLPIGGAAGAPAQPAALPALREDLSLYPAAPAADGSPAWHLADPAANRFYHLGWAAFEILARWQLGSAEAIVAAVNGETTLHIGLAEVDDIVRFLGQHQLLEASSERDSARFLGQLAARRTGWLSWLVKNYLFFRVPLVQPSRFLDRWVGHLELFWRRPFWLGAALFAMLSLLLVARQWDSFVHSFAGYQGWQMLLSFGVALSFAKVIHELGHAFVARRHGCKVPSMGVAFLVMWPVLYTDTNEAWKLSSARARLQIGVAGMAAELLLAIVATFLWVILPDGGARASVFFLATTSWIVTLGINLSPFMRFDGYFLLSDLLGMPNLHQRAFAVGRWWLREWLFGFGFAAPETLTRGRERLLIGFAFATWLYRLTVFLSIAFLVYHAFFKMLGIVLMIIELGWFIALPMIKEVQAWWTLRARMRWHGRSRRSAVLGLLLLALVALPWQHELDAPAVLMPAREQVMFANVPARVESIAEAVTGEGGAGGPGVRAGQQLMVLQSPDLDFRIRQAQVQEENWRRQLGQQSFNAALLGQGDALRSHWQEAQVQLNGLLEERGRLTVTAPFDGSIVARNLDLAVGGWVAPREGLLVIGDRRSAAVEVFVGEDELGRLHRGGAARFVPEAAEFGRRDCRIASIDPFNVSELDEPALASIYGGRVNVQRDARGALLPVSGIYRVRLDQCSPAVAPALRLRGTAHLAADWQSPLLNWLTHLLRVLLREGGL